MGLIPRARTLFTCLSLTWGACRNFFFLIMQFLGSGPLKGQNSAWYPRPKSWISFHTLFLLCCHRPSLAQTHIITHRQKMPNHTNLPSFHFQNCPKLLEIFPTIHYTNRKKSLKSKISVVSSVPTRACLFLLFNHFHRSGAGSAHQRCC